jgi:hypothetical protein
MTVPASPEKMTDVSIDSDTPVCHKTVGGEPCLLDREVEEKGVADMLEALSDEEKGQIPHPDMPLRHFRGEKVRY